MNKYNVRLVVELSVFMDVEASSIDEASKIIDKSIEEENNAFTELLKFTDNNNIDTQLVYQFYENDTE